jgi:mannitol/fructose-specific phosphotransferase system IIA component (Ntr-type)
MKLAKLLCADHIILDMKAVEHWPSIVELVGHLVKTGQLPEEQREEMLQAFQEREEQVSTGVGSGVAIPHAFSDYLDHVVAVFGRSKAGIEFNALDNAPVHFIVLFIVPRKDYHMHLRTLAAIAKMFTNGEVLRQLAAAGSVEEILAIFESKPSRVGA